MSKRTSVAVLLLTLGVAPWTMAQLTSDGVGKNKPIVVSPFEPAPDNPTLFKGSPPGTPPPPPDAEPGGTAKPGQAPSGRAPDGARGARGTVTRGSAPGPRGDVGADGLTSLATASDDTWENWWETNKFDFITLRRVEDDPFTGQGQLRESRDEKAARLTQIAVVVRDQVVPLLRELTASDDPGVRAASIVALAKLRDLEATSRAQEMLRDQNFDVRRAAMLALGVLDMGRARYVLMNVASDSDLGRSFLETSRLSDEDRAIALLSTSLRGNDSAETMLSDLLAERDDLSNELLAVVCQSVGLMGSTRSLDALSRVARDERRPGFVRSAAATSLGRLGDPSAVPVLMELLDASIEARRAAIVALGSVAHGGMDGVVARLVRALASDGDSATRHFAAVSLGRLGGAHAQGALSAALADANSDMRPWIALGLGLSERSTPSESVLPLLLDQASREKNAGTLGALLIALGLSGDARALPALVDGLHAGSTSVASQAALALGLSRLPDAQPVLRAALREASSPLVRRQAALGLGVLGDSSAIPDMLELIRTSSDPYVASSAAIGLAFLGDGDAIGPLLHIIRSRGPGGVATTYAVVAVGQLFDSERRPALARLASNDNYLARSSAVSSLLSLGF